MSSLAVVLLLSSFAAGAAKETVIYSFGTNPNDGMTPNGGLIFDSAGNLYGTTGYMPTQNCPDCGIVFQLTPTSSGPWTETILYQFCSLPNCADGQSPRAGVILDASGNLYGTTKYGGANDYGTVFELSPPSAPGGSWTETVLWSFDYSDSASPVGKLTWDAAGNLYGTTIGGGAHGFGSVFELSPGSNGWTFNDLYSFCVDYPVCSDGRFPMAGVTFDNSGNLYGTTEFGGPFSEGKWGLVYELSPIGGGNWSETVIRAFSSVAGNPLSEVFFDNAGNLYGTLTQGAAHSPSQCGGVFRLTPTNGSWKQALLEFDDSGARGCTPLAGVFVDNAANAVFGTTETSAFPYGGDVFEVSGGHDKILYTFCQLDHCADGNQANSFLTPRNGKLYGTTLEGGTSSACGQFGCGVVYEITP